MPNFPLLPTTLFKVCRRRAHRLLEGGIPSPEGMVSKQGGISAPGTTKVIKWVPSSLRFSLGSWSLERERAGEGDGRGKLANHVTDEGYEAAGGWVRGARVRSVVFRLFGLRKKIRL